MLNKLMETAQLLYTVAREKQVINNHFYYKYDIHPQYYHLFIYISMPFQFPALVIIMPGRVELRFHHDQIYKD